MNFNITLVKPKTFNISQLSTVENKVDYKNSNIESMQMIDLQNINYNGGYTMASETDYENALPIFQYWANIIMNGGSYNV